MDEIGAPLDLAGDGALAPAVDLSGARRAPFAHQAANVALMLDGRRWLGLFDEPRLGKSKSVIDAAHAMHARGLIDKVVIVCPAQNRRETWFDPDYGQLAEHLWPGVPSLVKEYHAKAAEWGWGDCWSGAPRIEWTVTNYEWLRTGANLNAGTRKRSPLYERAADLADECGPRTLLVLDESSAVASSKSAQTKMARLVRARCGYVVLLNGTPMGHSPMALYSQAEMMSPSILDCRTVVHFRSRYCVMGGWMGRQILKWVNLDDLTARLRPHVSAHRKRECLDLPPQLPPVTLSFALSEPVWKAYKGMRDDMVAWLSADRAATARQAFVKALRLAQLTSGFVGGVEAAPKDVVGDGEDADWLLANEGITIGGAPTTEAPFLNETVDVHRERVDYLIQWLGARLDEEPDLRLIIWTRFRRELEAVWAALEDRFEPVPKAKIHGGQGQAERREALSLVHPKTRPRGPLLFVGTVRSGGAGLNMTGANAELYLSNDLSLNARMQSYERAHGPGQDGPVAYFDVVATGPAGQRTIDHVVLKALRAGENLAQWTVSRWAEAL